MRTRTLASLAISGDGERWTLINASPDLRAQIQNNRHLHPRGSIRASPIEAVVLTGGSTRPPACFSRRERSPFTLIATAATLAAGARNPMSDVLGSDVMWRRAITPGEGFSLGGGANAELFIVPGKVPLYLEGDNHEIAGKSAANVGVEISACAKGSFTRPARRRSRRRLGLERDRTTNTARTIPARST
ncbi:MAG: MBL fold metallo-hydrolase [Pseudolabrys sp.]